MKFKPRNPVVRSPILRKGGVHQKTRKAQRNRAKRELQREVRRSVERGDPFPYDAGNTRSADKHGVDDAHTDQ